MDTASNVSENARETLKEVRDGAREAGNAAAEAAGTIQKDLQALRDDLARLADQVRVIVSEKGNAAWRRAKSGVDGVVSDAQSKGQDAVGAMREVSDNFVEAIDESIKERPYTTLAIAIGLGFLFGATWRR
jgi:ElaB/YqjD/DUF883 family membrane-anchored ribosome-binding protein